MNPDIDVSLAHYLPLLKVKFGQNWSEHHCEKPGCGWCIIGDGGLKAHRSLCAAVSSGIKVFPGSGVSVVTGLLYLFKHDYAFFVAQAALTILELSFSAHHTRIMHLR